MPAVNAFSMRKNNPPRKNLSIWNMRFGFVCRAIPKKWKWLYLKPSCIWLMNGKVRPCMKAKWPQWKRAWKIYWKNNCNKKGKVFKPCLWVTLNREDFLNAYAFGFVCGIVSVLCAVFRICIFTHVNFLLVTVNSFRRHERLCVRFWSVRLRLIWENCTASYVVPSDIL